VELDGIPASAARSYLLELLRTLGPAIPVVAKWQDRAMGGLPGSVRLLAGTGGNVLTRAGHGAAATGDLVVLLAPLLPDPAALQGLLPAFDEDPLIGFVQPRFGVSRADGVWQLPAEDGSAEQLSRASLPLLPGHYLMTEKLASCIVFRREVAAVLAAAPGQPADLRSAVLFELVHARRRGFRNLIVNRIVLPGTERAEQAYPQLDPASRRQLQALLPDTAKAERWFDRAPERRWEPLVSQARRARPGDRLPILMDCRGAPAFHNGTSEAMFSLLEALGPLISGWELEVLMNPEAARYHDVERRFPWARFLTQLPARSYAAAVCLNQPWHLSTVADLHQRAAVIAFNMLDTIAWDIVFPCDEEVGRAWQFIADHADGLTYISRFSRDRFRFRFPVSDRVLESVELLSLDPVDYTQGSEAAGRGDYVLVFGNSYEHKAVGPTVDLLARAFPFLPIRALGVEKPTAPNVISLESGHLPESEIDAMIGGARLLVFPSYYEGFGFPVVRGLAYGQTVVVRRSPLWRELAGMTRAPGRLVEYELPHELVRCVGRALSGERVDVLPLGEDLPEGASPPSWADCARSMMSFVERMLRRVDFQAWQRRDRALSAALQ